MELMPARIAFEMQRKAAAQAYFAQLLRIVGPPPGLDPPHVFGQHVPSLCHAGGARGQFPDVRWGLEQTGRLDAAQMNKTPPGLCNVDARLWSSQWLDTAPSWKDLSGLSTPTSCGAGTSTSDDEQSSVSSGPERVQTPGSVARQLSVEQLCDRVRVLWPVHAQKLKCTDRNILSPSFDLLADVTGRLMLKPIVMGSKRGESCFKRSKGRGCIELKCDAATSSDHPKFEFRLSIGDGTNWQPMRGPVTHDFCEGSVCGLPSASEEWKFHSAVNDDSNMFTICLEVSTLS